MNDPVVDKIVTHLARVAAGEVLPQRDALWDRVMSLDTLENAAALARLVTT